MNFRNLTLMKMKTIVFLGMIFVFQVSFAAVSQETIDAARRDYASAIRWFCCGKAEAVLTGLEKRLQHAGVRHDEASQIVREVEAVASSRILKERIVTVGVIAAVVGGGILWNIRDQGSKESADESSGGAGVSSADGPRQTTNHDDTKSFCRSVSPSATRVSTLSGHSPCYADYGLQGILADDEDENRCPNFSLPMSRNYSYLSNAP